ncbi:hypothetical protein J2TS4_08380 [Paenibacillus sp. J2TS4]|nr:hypothetical protein J2TS4_08380 [Paenibacillus sp. J2TS4]
MAQQIECELGWGALRERASQSPTADESARGSRSTPDEVGSHVLVMASVSFNKTSR